MTKRNYNPRTSRLSEMAGGDAAFRLTAADREFLRDLAKVQIVSFDQASKTHYAQLKTKGSRSLPRLIQAGVIKERTVYISGRRPIKAFEFASREMASAWGGRMLKTGSSRSDYHELITSEIYFQLDRPDDFRLPGKFCSNDFSLVGDHVPDALYTDNATGELVLLEADAGNYSQQQITNKMASWQARGLRQLWAQPEKATVKINNLFNVDSSHSSIDLIIV